MERFSTAMREVDALFGAHYWTLAEVEAEVKKLAEQVAAQPYVELEKSKAQIKLRTQRTIELS